MIINIDKKLFDKVLWIVEGRNASIYKQLRVTPQTDTLSHARDIRTNGIKADIKSALIILKDSDVAITKYRVQKRTGISYNTIIKYFDAIYDEVCGG